MGALRPRFENLYDKLALIPELQPDRVSIAAESARARGLEISLAGSGQAFNWWANYSLAEVSDRIDGEEFPRSWDQRHALQVGMNWQVSEWNFAIAGNIRSGVGRRQICKLRKLLVPVANEKLSPSLGYETQINCHISPVLMPG